MAVDGCGFSTRARRVTIIGVVLIVFAGARWPPVDGARILAVELVPGKSHWNFMAAVLRALLDDGHYVTAFTPFVDGQRDNYTAVDISGESEKFTILNVDVARNVGMLGDVRTAIGHCARRSRSFCDAIHRNGRMREILRQGPAAAEPFDAIIVEPVWMDCASHLATELDVPVMFALPHASHAHFDRPWLGHVPNPATVSHVMARHASAPKTFVQRFANVAMFAYTALVLGYHDTWFRYTDPKPYDRCSSVPPSLIFVNSHYITDASRPLQPNVIRISGIHLTEPKPIPSDVLQFIENSLHGVILLTFGSTNKMSSLPEHVQTAFTEALGQISQRILWKYEGEMQNKPDNVMIKKWLPQRDILLHPNVKLFISHGGVSGVYEALDASVPVLGFPLFFDQHRNVASLVDKGMAIGMDLSSVTKDVLLKNVLELVHDKKYKKNAVIASKLFKDRPMTPAQSVVYWTQYVIRHKGAPHLRSQALNLSWYQYFLLDVIGVTLIAFLVVVFSIRYASKKLHLTIKSLRRRKFKNI